MMAAEIFGCFVSTDEKTRRRRELAVKFTRFDAVGVEVGVGEEGRDRD